MKISWKIILLAVVIALIPLAIYGYYYPQLPEQVATHFDFMGNADGFTNREELWKPMLLPLIFVPLFVVLPRIDPRGKSYEKLGEVYSYFIVGISAFFGILFSAMVLNSLPEIQIPIEKVTPSAVGLFFLVLGNYLPKIKQNYTMGIKTSWTLHSEVVWNKTHRLAGPCFMIAGLGVLIGVVCAPAWMFALLIGAIFVAVGIPWVMSYVYYKREQ